MAINLDKINGALDRLDPEKKSGGNTNTSVVKLPEGESVIRIAPYNLDPEMPFQELHFHYAIGGKTFLCPKRMKNDDCPICDMATEAWNEFTSTQEESAKDVFKKLVATLRVYIPIVIRGQEDKGLRWWAVSPRSTYKEILTKVKNGMAQGIDITSTSDGLDLIVQVKKGFNDWLVPESIDTALRPSPLAESDDAIDALIKTITPIDEVATYRELSEMKAALSAFANPNAETKGENNEAGKNKSFNGGRDIDFAAAGESDVVKAVGDKMDKMLS